MTQRELVAHVWVTVRLAIESKIADLAILGTRRRGVSRNEVRAISCQATSHFGWGAGGFVLGMIFWNFIGFWSFLANNVLLPHEPARPGQVVAAPGVLEHDGAIAMVGGRNAGWRGGGDDRGAIATPDAADPAVIRGSGYDHTAVHSVDRASLVYTGYQPVKLTKRERLRGEVRAGDQVRQREVYVANCSELVIDAASGSTYQRPCKAIPSDGSAPGEGVGNPLVTAQSFVDAE